MLRHHRGAPPPEDASSSSSDSEEAFSAFSRKTKKAKTTTSSSSSTRDAPKQKEESNKNKSVAQSIAGSFSGLKDESSGLGEKFEPTQNLPKQQQLPASLTSSMKRHHGASEARKAKMESLLMELQSTETSATKTRHNNNSNNAPQRQQQQQQQSTKGSFVQPGEEHITTNLFVGNLSTSITEEQLTELFSQFGELYSVKIMWARTPEELSRNRHTGFVCFMHRKDAEDALKSLDETDPFQVGRRIMIRWGKHVKKIVKSTAAPPIPRHVNRYSATSNEAAKATALSPTDIVPDDTSCPRIQVVLPPDPQRRQLIDTVAAFVAKDGAQLEVRIRDDPTLDFLRIIPSQQNTAERIYYKWRVYSFCQGDGLHAWRTEPFRMFQSSGAVVWIPPPVNAEAARQELFEKERKAAELEQQKQQRRLMLQKERPTVEHSRVQLVPEERAEFDQLFRIELCASRGAICRAMAFCFEKSGAFAQICDLIKDLLTEKLPAATNDINVAAEVKIAQLYVLSDILFNSQQPGVRNAFRFRDSIEKMAPEIFTSLGEQTMSWGRITRNKLAMAVRNVLGAWTNWSVYSPSFLDELQARFEGKPLESITAELKPPSLQENEAKSSSRHETIMETANQTGARMEPIEVCAEVPAVSLNQDSVVPKKSGQAFVSVYAEQPFEDDDDVDGEALEEADVDGESLDDVDGEVLDENEVNQTG